MNMNTRVKSASGLNQDLITAPQNQLRETSVFPLRSMTMFHHVMNGTVILYGPDLAEYQMRISKSISFKKKFDIYNNEKEPFYCRIIDELKVQFDRFIDIKNNIWQK